MASQYAEDGAPMSRKTPAATSLPVCRLRSEPERGAAAPSSLRSQEIQALLDVGYSTRAIAKKLRIAVSDVADALHPQEDVT
jgi:DNA-binding NarL/FixJ family response regulator